MGRRLSSSQRQCQTLFPTNQRVNGWGRGDAYLFPPTIAALQNTSVPVVRRPLAPHAQLINAVAVRNGGDPLPEGTAGRVLAEGFVGSCKGLLSGVFGTVIGRQQKTAQRENSGVVLLIENFESRAVCHVGARALVSNRCREIRLSPGLITGFDRDGFEKEWEGSDSRTGSHYERAFGGSVGYLAGV